MASLSPDDRAIIAKHPLDISLDHLREPLRKIEQSYKPSSFSYNGTVESPDVGPQKAISRLLYTLQGHEVALDLRSKIGNSNVATELSKLFGLVQSGRYNYEHYRALSRLVVKQAADIDIWNAVLNLIITVSRITPPTSIPVSFDGTHITFLSSSFQSSEQDHRDEHLSDSRGILYTTESTSDLTGDEAQRQLDLFVKRRGTGTSGKYDWKDVRVIHSFFLHGTIMELWVFDRSGPYSSGEFDIHEEPEKFIRAIVGYAMMDDEEVGLDTFTELDDTGRFITISRDPTGKENRMQLDEAPFVKQRAVFSWTSDKRPPEADHLRLAREKGVEGIAKLIGYQRITNISELRNGLTFPSHQFRDGTASASSSFSQTQLALSEFARRPQSTNSVPSAIRELLTTLRDAIKAHRSLYLKGNILHRDISENIIITNKDENGDFTGMLIDLDLAKVLGSGRSGARHQTGTMEFMAIEVLQGIDHTYRHDLESFFYVLIWLCARRTWEREFLCSAVDRPKRNILTKWYTASFVDIADAKKGYIHVDDFEKLLIEFPQAFNLVKPLCKKIRSILFPLLEDGALFIGTPSDPPEKLYHPVIEPFDKAIVDIAAREGSG
ncbi:MAG: hypothetical protein Q9179_004676 [Wetmoreana sp. 5 TL-2023]